MSQSWSGGLTIMFRSKDLIEVHWLSSEPYPTYALFIRPLSASLGYQRFRMSHYQSKYSHKIQRSKFVELAYNYYQNFPSHTSLQRPLPSNRRPSPALRPRPHEQSSLCPLCKIPHQPFQSPQLHHQVHQL